MNKYESRALKHEYATTPSLMECLREHIVFCLFNDFDQLRDTSRIIVSCVNCKRKFKVTYNEIALRPLCSKCQELLDKNELHATDSMLKTLASRLSKMQNVLLGQSNETDF